MSARPRILMIGMGAFPEQPGGLNRYVAGLHAALPEAELVTLGPGAERPRATIVGDRHGQLPGRLRALRRAVRSRSADADIVDAHFALTAVAALGLLHRRPLVVHFHGPWADEGAVEGAAGPVIAVKRALERLVYRRARLVITLSDAFAHMAAERYGIEPSRIRAIPPGLDLDWFSPGDRTAARAALGVAEDVFVVAAARRLVPRMGLDVLLAAWPAVRAARPGAVLLLAGDGPERSNLETAALQGVRFLGRVDEATLRDCYRAADATAVPSLALEGFGLVVLESLACGTPAVVSALGGLPEAVAGLDPGLAVPPGDAAALAARLLAPLPSRERCRTHAATFTWERSAELHRAAYRSVLRPSVVFLDHTAKLSGGELALARLLPALEVNAHVILGEDGPLVPLLRAAGATVEILPFAIREVSREQAGSAGHVGGSLTYALRLARRLHALDPALVHANSLKAGLVGGVACRLVGLPLVWHVRDRISADYLPLRAVRLVRLATRLLPCAVIANSQTTAETLRVPAYVVPSPIEPQPERLPYDGPLRIGIVGRIAHWKGQHLFLEAFAEAFPREAGRADATAETARVIGAPLFGREEEEYAEGLLVLAERLGVGDRVTFTGFRRDIAAELATLDVLVHASVLPEPFGQVVVEGMAAGLVVVAADAGGPAEVVVHGSNGLLYLPGDATALAEQLRLIAADPALREHLAAGGRRTAERFTPAAVAALIQPIYRSLA